MKEVLVGQQLTSKCCSFVIYVHDVADSKASGVLYWPPYLTLSHVCIISLL